MREILKIADGKRGIRWRDPGHIGQGAEVAAEDGKLGICIVCEEKAVIKRQLHEDESPFRMLPTGLVEPNGICIVSRFFREVALGDGGKRRMGIELAVAHGSSVAGLAIAGSGDVADHVPMQKSLKCAIKSKGRQPIIG
jgi:hypothetical protein